MNLENSLKSNGLRVTQARKTIFEVLQSSKKALSAGGVCQIIESKHPGQSDQASVYRNLKLFEKMGLIHQLQSGQFSICNHQHEKEDSKHMHIVATCSKCQQTLEVSHHSEELCQLASGLKKQIKSFHNFSHLTLIGLCKSCS